MQTTAGRFIVEPFSPKAAHPNETELLYSAWECSWESHLREKIDDIAKRPVWKENSNEIVVNFINQARMEHGFKTFVARDPETGSTLGLIACQVWNGPVPIRTLNCFSLGTLWGLKIFSSGHQNEVSKALIRSALEYLRKLGCAKSVVLTLDSHDQFVDSGFEAANMLTKDLNSLASQDRYTSRDESILITKAGPEADEVVIANWRKMWLENGIPEHGFVDDSSEVTKEFLRHARTDLKYQTFVAKTLDGQLVGSISCQIWQGPFPKIVQPSLFECGTIWGVYVDPEMRRRGVATAMMEAALAHLKDHHCHSAILIAASSAGQRVYERLGFAPNSALVYDHTAEQPTSKEKPHEAPSDLMTLSTELEERLASFGVNSLNTTGIQAMVTATTQQLEAVFSDHPQRPQIIQAVREFQTHRGLYICPKDNWFTQNVKRFGRGFDMKTLADPKDLAHKFDRLSQRYDHWTVGNRSKIETFVVHCAKRSLLQDSSSGMRLLDVACGIGLQGQTLRLCGFQGQLVGTDISAGMIDRVRQRGCYDQAFVANANEPFDFGGEHRLFDVCLCTGAMELLDQEMVLASMAGITKEGGELWVSFQLTVGDAEDQSSCSTSHQNVRGVTRGVALRRLENAGYKVVSIEECKDAFFTPSPAQDGSLLPVPYLFCVARKE